MSKRTVYVLVVVVAGVIVGVPAWIMGLGLAWNVPFSFVTGMLYAEVML